MRALTQLGRAHKTQRNNWIFQNLTTTASHNKIVCVAGASGAVGRSLCLLLKLSPFVTELRIHDIINTAKTALELKFIENPAKIGLFHGRESMRSAFAGSDIILITAGSGRSVGMTRTDLLHINAGVIKDMAAAIADVAPTALVGIITNPVNIVVPIFAKVMEKYGKLNPSKVFGITTIDTVRANTFVAQLKELDPGKVFLPVVGGHSGSTIVPLISQCKPKVEFPENVVAMLMKKCQTSADYVKAVKGGESGCFVANAFACAKFTVSLLKALNGEPNVIESSYVISNVTPARFFATPLLLGRHGIERNLGIPKGISKLEQKMVDKAVVMLRTHIDQGEKIAMN